MSIPHLVSEKDQIFAQSHQFQQSKQKLTH